MLIPLAIFVFQWLRPRAGRDAIQFSAFDWMPRRGRLPHRRARVCLRLLATLALVLVAAGLGIESDRISQRKAPAAWMIALDVSSSMTAEDFQPGRRLEAAKLSLRDFVSRAPDVYFGLIIFASLPRLLVPLTQEKTAVLEALEGVREARFGEDGTAIGIALASAVNRLRSDYWGERNILLVTDGVNNRGSVAPPDAARFARAIGASIHALGMGTDTITRYWVPLESGDTRELRARIEIDDEALRGLAQESGGSYQRVRDSEQMRSGLSSMIRGGEERLRKVKEPDLDFRWIHALAWISIVCLGLEFTLDQLIFSDLPD